MLQKIYSVYSDDLNDVQLFVEAGKNHIACWCKKTGENSLRAFEFFQCDDYTQENFEALIDNTRLYSRLLTMPVNSTNFFWNNDEALCIAGNKNDPGFLKDNIELMMGSSPDSNVYSASTEDYTVAWRMKRQQQLSAQQCFRGAVFGHQFTSLLAGLKNANDAGFLFFYPHHFTFILFKQNKLQLIQTRKYAIAEDVLYFILNACKQYDINTQTDFFCGGFIEENSTLYSTLYQYFESLQLMKADDGLYATDAFNEYAPHYFLPYINYVV